MRIIIVLAGVGLLALASYYLLSQLIAVFTFPMGTIIIVLGLLISRPAGVTVDRDQATSARMLLDRAILGASIYQIVFLDSKLILKRLASSRTTILSVLILALAGLFVDGYLGALAGGAGGYAVQEYATQRNRRRNLKNNTLTTLGRGDLEIPYEDLKEVRLRKNKLLLEGKNGLAKIGLPKGYASQMSPKLRAILGGKYKSEGLFDSPLQSTQTTQPLTREIIKETVLVTCRHCGSRAPQGTLKCPNCGAIL